MTTIKILTIFLIVLGSSCITDKIAYPSALTGISIHKKSELEDLKYNYLLHIPRRDIDEYKTYPTIIYLHGAGQRGVFPEKLLKNGLPYYVNQKTDFPFIVISPQATYGGWWDPELLDKFLELMIKTYPIDKNSIYLTGYSMGGVGTWNLSAYNPKRFAAIAPLAGSGFKKDAKRLKSVPTWIFHGEDDTAVPINEAEIMYDALKEVNGDVKFTKLPGLNHNITKDVYFKDELYRWFLDQKK